MTPGTMLFYGGILLLIVSILLMLYFAVSGRSRKRKLDQYLKDQY